MGAALSMAPSIHSQGPLRPEVSQNQNHDLLIHNKDEVDDPMGDDKPTELLQEQDFVETAVGFHSQISLEIIYEVSDEEQIIGSLAKTMVFVAIFIKDHQWPSGCEQFLQHYDVLTGMVNQRREHGYSTAGMAEHLTKFRQHHMEAFKIICHGIGLTELSSYGAVMELD
jgi:hypothetical protein